MIMLQSNNTQKLITLGTLKITHTLKLTLKINSMLLSSILHVLELQLHTAHKPRFVSCWHKCRINLFLVLHVVLSTKH